MVTDTIIKKGYKQTELGIIPEDWELKKLGDIGESIIGLTYSPREVANYGKLVHRSSNIQNNQLSYLDNVYVDKVVNEKLILMENDILICVRNGSRNLIGKSALIKGKAVGETFGAFMSVFRSDKCQPYIFHLIISNLIQRQINQSLGATINQITNKTLNDFQIPYPSKIEEQTAISTALSDTDALIEHLEKLIAKKKAIKQGTMQQLLTGKKRLPGFSGEWEVKKLGEVCELKNGYSFKSSTYNEAGEYKIITIANVQDGYMVSSGTNNIVDLPLDIQEHQKLKMGDILISMTGNVGRVCFVNNKYSLLNQRVGKLVISKINKMFFFYVCNSRLFINSMILKAQGGAQGNIGKNDILGYEVEIPKQIEEQIAIAAILSDMDAEIESLEQKRDKYTMLKQGMMQQLLTGKIRIYANN